IASVVTRIVAEPRSQNQHNSPMAAMFDVFALTAVEVFERDGQAGLARYLERVEQTANIHAALLDQNGNEVSGRTLPEGATNVTSRVNQNNPYAIYFPPQQERALSAQLARGNGGKSYVLVGQLPRPGFPRPPPRLGEPGSFAFGIRIAA